MPRTAETPGKPATHRIQVLLNEDDAEALDRRRGDTPESAYVRGVLRAHLGTNELTQGHRFKRGKVIAERTVKGVTTKTYRCAEPGCPDTREG